MNSEKKKKYLKEYRKKNKEKIRINSKLYYKNNIKYEKERKKIWRKNNPKKWKAYILQMRIQNIKYHFNIDYETYKSLVKQCSDCGKTEQIVLHHIDFDKNNNNLSNFKSLCRSCHRKAHITLTICKNAT